MSRPRGAVEYVRDVGARAPGVPQVLGAQGSAPQGRHARYVRKHTWQRAAYRTVRAAYLAAQVTVNGKSTPPWTTRADCAGNPACDCGNAAAVAADGSVTLSWRTTTTTGGTFAAR